MPSPEFSPNNVWASNAPAGSATEELTLPSGQTCQARKVTVPSMIETGLLASVDVLTSMVDQYTRKIKGGKGVPDGSVKVDESILKNPDAIKNIVMMADMMMPHVVVSPVVRLHFTEQTVGQTKVTRMIPLEDRQPGAVYTDQIDLEDKMFLFDWAVGGINAFTSFRGETTGNVGGVVPRKGSSGSTKRRSRNN
jgi:hypothetical protein